MPTQKAGVGPRLMADCQVKAAEAVSPAGASSRALHSSPRMRAREKFWAFTLLAEFLT